MSDKPIPDSYWVVPAKFLAGGYPGSSQGNGELARQRMAALMEAGFDTFIDLTRPGETPGYQEALDAEAARHNQSVDHQLKPIEDRGVPSVGQMTDILNSIDAALSAGRKVYLHCMGGIGRTGTVVGCWLARHGLTGEEALRRLNALYRASEQSRFFERSPEVDAQVLFVLDWKEATPSGPAVTARSNEKSTGAIDWHARFLQQAAWTQPLRAHIFQRIGLEEGSRVLEAGCGTGALLADLPEAAIPFGIDKEPGRVMEAARHVPRARLTCSDVRCLPYADGTFAATFCHFLLLWVPEPLKALQEMARVTLPGGHVLAFAEPEYKSRVDTPAELAPLGRAQAEALLRQGADPDVGGRLGKLFQQAGISLVETGRLEEAGDRLPTQAEWQQEWIVLEEDLKSFVPAQELQRLKRLDLQAWRRGQRRLYVPTYFAWGRVGQMV